jgi:hypothetical protein
MTTRRSLFAALFGLPAAALTLASPSPSKTESVVGSASVEPDQVVSVLVRQRFTDSLGRHFFAGDFLRITVAELEAMLKGLDQLPELLFTDPSLCIDPQTRRVYRNAGA